jgi:multisubunit Na+/H+ antiporter MnhG subunit
MTNTSPSSPQTLSIIAIVLGVLAVVAVTASFFTEPVWGLRAIALVLIVIGLALGRAAGGRPPTAERP